MLDNGSGEAIKAHATTADIRHETHFIACGAK
jgi:hypothetical protein